MDKLKDSLCKDVTCWVQEQPNHYVECCGFDKLWKSGFDPEDFHAHFYKSCRQYHCIRFCITKYDYEIFHIMLLHGNFYRIIGDLLPIS